MIHSLSPALSHGISSVNIVTPSRCPTRAIADISAVRHQHHDRDARFLCGFEYPIELTRDERPFEQRRVKREAQSEHSGLFEPAPNLCTGISRSDIEPAHDGTARTG
jgi:hypothetical protein